MKKRKKRYDIFDSLKESLIGRIDDRDIQLIKDGFVRLLKNVKYKFPYRFAKAKIIYYQFNKHETAESNEQWFCVKNCVDNDKTYVFGSNDVCYIRHGKPIKYYKYFRYSTKYNILELVSDYYNKVPIFYHLSDGIYEKHNGIEYIKDIDY